uniref:Uncharacterized protein n=1 Tax=Romanomermis culicivorax TaxID=13658 RepID=A0A915JUE7_ROMCU
MMTINAKKPNILRAGIPPPGIAANTIAAMRPLHTVPRSNKRARCIQLAFTKGNISPVFVSSQFTDYISPVQCDAEIQKRLEALKNPSKLDFKAPLPTAHPMDMEQAASSSASLPTTTASLPPTVLTLTRSTIAITTASLPPMASTSVYSTATSTVKSVSTSRATIQPQLVITTHPALRAAPAAGAVLQFQLQLPSESTMLPNYVHF